MTHDALPSDATAEEDLAARYKATGPHEVIQFNEDWYDEARHRHVPAKIYFPPTSDIPCPVIVFSHGLGGSRAGYTYLGRHWTSHGYIAVHVQHKGSDIEVWHQAKGVMPEMRAAAQDPANAVNRPRDVSFALDQLARIHFDHPRLKGLLDLDRIGMAGHSFGAFTTLAVSGQVFFDRLGNEWHLADPRVKAMIAMSPSGPRKKEHLEKYYAGIKVPGMHMTGTNDASPIGVIPIADRRIPFDQIRDADQYLVTFNEGDHMVFAGLPRRRKLEQELRFQELIRMSTTAFWDAYLRNDPRVKTWLADGGLQRAMGEQAAVEAK